MGSCTSPNASGKPNRVSELETSISSPWVPMEKRPSIPAIYNPDGIILRTVSPLDEDVTKVSHPAELSSSCNSA